MITWKRQGAAVVGEVSFTDGRRGNIVLVGPHTNPRGAALLVPGEDPEKPATQFFSPETELLSPELIVEMLCVQERAFGNRGLPKPQDLS